MQEDNVKFEIIFKFHWTKTRAKVVYWLFIMGFVANTAELSANNDVPPNFESIFSFYFRLTGQQWET